MPSMYPQVSILSPIHLSKIGHIIGAYSSIQFDKKACRTSPLSGDTYITKLLKSNDQWILEVLCMPKEAFTELCHRMSTRAGGLKVGEKVTIEQPIAIFLSVVGHGCSNTEVQE